MYHLEYATIANEELNEIINQTGCPKTCRYKEYKLVGEDKLQPVTQHGLKGCSKTAQILFSLYLGPRCWDLQNSCAYSP